MKRVERCHRFLKNHADLTSANMTHDAVLFTDKLFTVKFDGAFGAVRGERVGEQLHDGQRCYGFARATFADQGHRFAFFDIEGDILHRMKNTLWRFEINGKVIYA